MKIKRIIYLILLIIWMTTVFAFSNEPSEDSSDTSGNTIRAIIDLIPSISRMDANQKEQIVESLQPYARKLAHFTLYTIGGLVVFLMNNEYNLIEKKKIIYSILFGFFYAISDEIHQTFIPGRSRRNKRCINRYIRCNFRCSCMYDYTKNKKRN